jgi:hypothetical protein
MPEKFEGIAITPKGIKDRDMDEMSKPKAKAKKEQEVQEQEQGEENPFAEYNNRTYQSYVKNNHADKIPHGV